MQLSHAPERISVRFDDPNLVSCGGLVAVAALAQRAGLPRLLERVTVPAANAAAKIVAVVLGMVAGADSITDLDVLRHGGMRRVFDGVRAPSTLGTLLRSFTFGHVRQLDAVGSRLLVALARTAPLLPGAGDRDRLAYLDLDDTVRETHGYAKQGAERGYSGVAGLNVLLATVSTPAATPLIAGARLRRGGANSVRGAAKLLVDTLAAVKRAGVRAVVVVRADSAFYARSVVLAAGRAGARFSVTMRQTPAVSRAIAGIDPAAWTPIRYRCAVFDPEAGQWVSEAEVAEVPYSAFGARYPSQQIHARLIVRRVRRLNPDHHGPGPRQLAGHLERDQLELFAAYRYHAIFTDSPLPTLEAEAAHRDHAIVEQVIADLKNSALAHLPSGQFNANGAWLACATMAYNLTRAAGALAGGRHTRARTTTLRARLINVAARLARSARHLTLHLPEHWPWQHDLDRLLRATLHDPVPTATA
jgi:hypothetical protein